MPFTPFHMGPGCAFKALGGKHFSLMVFGFAQVAVDVEVLVHLLRHDEVAHGFFHSGLGATLIGLFSAIIGRPICQFLLDRWKPDPADGLMTWLRGPPKISWRAAFVGAFVGVYSHVLIDSLLHADVEPFGPFVEGNPFADSVTMGALDLACVGIGMLGVVGLMIRAAVENQ